MNNQRKETILVLFIAFLGMISLFVRTTRMTYSHAEFEHPWDHHVYIEMATDQPLAPHAPPFGWRILNPLLAKLLPFDLLTNFMVLSFIALWMTGTVTYFMLRKAGFSNYLALTGLLFFLSLGWATRFNIYDFWLTDPMSFLFITATLWSIFAKKDLIFVLLLTIGVTAKENVIFVAPLYYTLNSEKLLDLKILFRTFYLVAPSLLILSLLRIFIMPANGEYELVNLLRDIGFPRIQNLHFDRSFIYSTGTFGVSLMVLPLFAMKRNLPLLWRFLPFIVLTYISLLFAINTQRLLVSIFPVVIIMALHGIKSIVDKIGVND